MPFPDELAHAVTVTEYRPAWPGEFEELAARVAGALAAARGTVAAIDHVGSTSVPGLAAKDCVDAMVRVADVDAELCWARETGWAPA